MPLKLADDSLFFHIPRTGGTFITEVLQKLNLVSVTRGHKHDAPGSFPINMHVKHRMFIRDPLNWVIGIWKYQTARDWRGWSTTRINRVWHPFLELYPTPEEAQNDPEFFLYWIIDKHPEFVSRTYAKFLDWPTKQFVGTTENLEEDLILMLSEFGIRRGRIEGLMKKANRNATKSQQIKISNKCIDRFFDTEAWAIMIYNIVKETHNGSPYLSK
jgi:hypothetical protein